MDKRNIIQPCMRTITGRSFCAKITLRLGTVNLLQLENSSLLGLKWSNSVLEVKATLGLGGQSGQRVRAEQQWKGMRWKGCGHVNSVRLHTTAQGDL